jgi:arylsulfatase
MAMEHSLPFILQFDESLDIGSDTLTGVNDEDYQPPFAFNGKINKITLRINRPELSADDIAKLRKAEAEKKSSD